MLSARNTTAIFFLIFGLAGGGGAVLAADAGRGSAGLAALAVTVENTGVLPIDCAAAVAHWFSVDLGSVPGGATATLPLWRDSAAGTVYTLNLHGDRLPVERLWCGLAGRSWATRSEIALPRQAGAAADIRIACSGDGERLTCR